MHNFMIHTLAALDKISSQIESSMYKLQRIIRSVTFVEIFIEMRIYDG